MFDLAQHISNRTGQFQRSPRSKPGERVALLLAGGDGTRLQELTRRIAGSPIPKQYCRLLHGQSLFEATVSRSQQFVSPERTFAVITESHVGLAAEQFRHIPEGNIIVQPRNRDTGPGIIFALQHIARRFPDAVVAAFPTDHYVDDGVGFITHVHQAAAIVEKYPSRIAILGVAPDRPEPGYGYLVPSGLPRLPGLPPHLLQVAHFREKPTAVEARCLIAAGALWNTFLMVFRVSWMLELLRGMALPECEPILSLWNDPARASEVYETIQPWSFSHRVLTRIAERVLVLRMLDVGWSDWGSPESIERTFSRLKKPPPWRRAEDALLQLGESTPQTA
jgi:mannose-1-phosphate guanylyltransferase